MAQPADDIITRTPTFHDTDAAYVLPNDAAEHARLLSQHTALVALLKGRILHAPLTTPTKILDVGCGTGITTRHLATTSPTATHVYGIDLCPVPTDPSIPTLTFIQRNIRTLARLRPPPSNPPPTTSSTAASSSAA